MKNFQKIVIPVFNLYMYIYIYRELSKSLTIGLRRPHLEEEGEGEDSNEAQGVSKHRKTGPIEHQQQGNQIKKRIKVTTAKTKEAIEAAITQITTCKIIGVLMWLM